MVKVVIFYNNYFICINRKAGHSISSFVSENLVYPCVIMIDPASAWNLVYKCNIIFY